MRGIDEPRKHAARKTPGIGVKLLNKGLGRPEGPLEIDNHEGAVRMHGGSAGAPGPAGVMGGSGALFLTTASFLVHGGPSAGLGRFLANAALFITFLDVAGLSLLFAGVTAFV